jgi:hypothetical protein
MKKLLYICFAALIMLSACINNENNSRLINDKAALPAGFDTLGLKVMSSFINKKLGTMATLYANPLALKNAVTGLKIHEPGEVFTLVTWKQQDDDHWFGAKIPGDLLFAEVISINGDGNGTIINYKKYTGKSLAAVQDTLHQHDRIKYIFDQQPAVMP